MSIDIGLASLCIVLLSGCEADRTPSVQVYPVSGKVLVDDQPANGAMVTFHPAEAVANPRAQRSYATVDDDGNFQLSTYQPADGAPPGKYAVTISWPGKLPRGADLTAVPPDRLRGRFISPQKPYKMVTVPEQEIVLDPFEISR
ncbi:carboxypeptidase-like regulatory domain-containing protein [Bremerella sp. JC770]|uniref:carboxypeptidase-like regulatory domain-containing protein n=1 Tax=Bremerella sp. JC770 TaxID=3232137 RepID=UPI003457E4EB